jgi:branched-chain amino acid aminotransferase
MMLSSLLLLVLGIAVCAAMTVGAAMLSKQHMGADANIDWDSFSFGLNGVRTDSMWLNHATVHENGKATYSSSTKECLTALANLEISPAATVLSYGQSLFEGIKAFRRVDGSIALFRPELNAHRMQRGAERFLSPPVPTDIFVHACEAVVRANAKWVPPIGKGALYLRPLLLGTGVALGVGPSSESTFCIYSSPVGNYFKGGLKAIRLQAVRGFSRAAVGGTGAVKTSGNYAPVFLVQQEVKRRGYDEALCLDASR